MKTAILAVLVAVVMFGVVPVQAEDLPKISRGAKRIESAVVYSGCFSGSPCAYTHHLSLSFSDREGWLIPFHRGTTFRIVEVPKLDGTYAHVKRRASKVRCTVYVRNAETRAAWENLLDRYQPKLPVDVVPRY